MIKDLNTVLSHLNARSRSRAKSKEHLLQNLNISRSRLDSVIKKLNREGYINIFMRSCENHQQLNREDWENAILCKLSRRGKVFLKDGAYQETVHHIEPMKSAVGF